MIGVGELRTGIDFTPSTITMSVLEASLSISLSAPNSLEYAHELAVSTSGNSMTTSRLGVQSPCTTSMSSPRTMDFPSRDSTVGSSLARNSAKRSASVITTSVITWAANVQLIFSFEWFVDIATRKFENPEIGFNVMLRKASRQNCI